MPEYSVEGKLVVLLETANEGVIMERIGSIEKGKDADLALFDGDPFEYTSHSTATIIDGGGIEGKQPGVAMAEGSTVDLLVLSTA